MGKTLDEFQAEIGAWGDATFPKSNAQSVIAHFREEADEFLAEWEQPTDAGTRTLEDEAADCFLLVTQFAHKCGFSLYEAAERKMAINRTRKWTVDAGTHTKHEEVPS